MPNSKLKIVFMGTPDFAVPPLQTLARHPDFEIQAVVTQEDKKVGRKQKITPPPIKKAALELGLAILQPANMKKKREFQKLLKGLQPDFIVVVAYGQILPEQILEIPRYSSINIHPSLLPKYRGATPIEEALLHGDHETGVTIMKMDTKLDNGAIYIIKKVPIDTQDNALTLRAKLSLIGAEMLPFVLKDIAENDLKPIPQIESGATYCHKIEKEDGLIDPKKLTAEEIYNRIRAYTPWPSVFLMLNGKRLKILEANIDPEKNAPPGKTTELGKNSIGIGTKKGLLIPKKVQLEGKAAMPIETFLAGNRNIFQ